jgi:BA14K-like protein
MDVAGEGIMTTGRRFKLAVAAVAMGVMAGVAAAQATPFIKAAPLVAETVSVDGAGVVDGAGAVGTPGLATTIQYRGRGYGYRGRGGYGLPLLGAGIIAGAIIADRAYRPRYRYYDAVDYNGPYYRPADYRGSDRQLCAENFRSFEWRTGLYTTYGGEKRMCPYLR